MRSHSRFQPRIFQQRCRTDYLTADLAPRLLALNRCDYLFLTLICYFAMATMKARTLDHCRRKTFESVWKWGIFDKSVLEKHPNGHRARQSTFS